MTQIFFREMQRLKSLLQVQGEKVEKQVRKSSDALLKFDKETAKKVVHRDDDIDQREIDLQEECFKLMALHQPVAYDLRFLVAVLKFNNDLERIADLAADNAKRTIKLADLGATSLTYDFNVMATTARQMLHQALQALVNVDAEATEDIFTQEKILNRMHKENSQAVVVALGKYPEQAQSLVHQLVISRNMERIGDLATNLGEEVIYIVRGEIVRHNKSPLDS